MERYDEVWKGGTLVRSYLEGVRGGIPFGAEQIEAMLRVIEARGEPVTAFADIGCGSGTLARALLTRYPQAHCTLVDFSPPMLEAARLQFATHRPQPQVISADLALPTWSASLADRRVDVIVSGYAIHHLPDHRKRELYGEIFALLAPGGMFVNVEHVASRTPWIETIADNLMIESLYAFQAQQGMGKTRDQIAEEFVRRPDKSANILAPVEVQCDWLRSLGFDDVDCYFKAFELAVFGGRKPRR